MQHHPTPPITFDRDKVIKALYADTDVAAAIGKMHPEELREEMKQEMFVVVCAMGEVQLQQLHESGQIKVYLYGTLYRMVKSDRSTFFNTHRKYREQLLNSLAEISTDGFLEYTKANLGEDGIGETPQGSLSGLATQPAGLIQDDADAGDRLIERVNIAVDELDPYEAGLIRLYAQMGQSCQPIAKATGIPVRSIRYAISEARIKLKKNLRNG